MMKQIIISTFFVIGLCVLTLSAYQQAGHFISVVSAQEEETDELQQKEERNAEAESSEEESDQSEDESDTEQDAADEEQAESEQEEESGDEDGPSSEDGIDDAEIEELKEKVASKVDELTETEYGTAGFVQKINDNTLLLNTRTKDIEVIIDEDITEIYAIEKGSLRDRDADDLEITDYITVIGPELQGTINANAIIFDTSYTVRSGKIVEVNEDDFYISVVTIDKSTYTLDVEKDTDSEMYNIKTQQLEGIGFSKLKEGDTVHFTAPVGWRDDQDRFSVNSLLIIPQEYFLK